MYSFERPLYYFQENVQFNEIFWIFVANFLTECLKPPPNSIISYNSEMKNILITEAVYLKNVMFELHIKNISVMSLTHMQS